MLEVKVYINDVPIKYSLSEDATILGLKEMISFDTQDEPKYQQLKLYGSENMLEDSKMVSSLGRSGLFLQYSSSKAMVENRRMADEYYPELGFGISMLTMTIDVDGKSRNGFTLEGILEVHIHKDHDFQLSVPAPNFIAIYNIAVRSESKVTFSLKFHGLPIRSSESTQVFLLSLRHITFDRIFSGAKLS